jgi:hypothetical protein
LMVTTATKKPKIQRCIRQQAAISGHTQSKKNKA